MEEEMSKGLLMRMLQSSNASYHFSRGYTCQSVGRINSRGIWLGDDPLSYSLPLLLLQLSLISILTRSLHLLLKPLGQPLIFCQILGGLILGPSVFGRSHAFAHKVFPVKGKIVIETISVFSIMLFIFLIGVKIDPAMVLRTGKKALLIGVLSFFVPYALASLVAFLLCKIVSLDAEAARLMSLLVLILCYSSFPVVTCFLSELKILNTEIGRLASSSSLICLLLILLIVLGVRSAAIWTIRHTPEGKPVKGLHVFLLLVMLLGCGFTGEVIGMNSLFAAFLVGLVIPDGPPLAAALVEQLDCFVSILLMPSFFAVCGSKVNLFAIQNMKSLAVILLVAFVAFLGKTMAAILPTLFYRMPFRDALSLALIMNSKGFVELAILTAMKRANEMNTEVFSIMIVSVLTVTGVVSPLVKILYDPSRGFVAYKRRTFFHMRNDEELRVLACIHNQDNVEAIVNLLDASNISKEKPINLVVLHLVKLVGRASSILVAHHPRGKLSDNPTQSERIFSAFRKVEQQNRGTVTINCFKGISPYATMHNDVCSIALEKRTTFIILPFHKQWSLGEWVDSHNAFRHLNRYVLRKAPCSVGILIDRGSHRKIRCIIEEPLVYRVAIVFFGGADDREALAYARRMSENPKVTLTVIRFSALKEIVGGTERSKMLDVQLLGDFMTKFEQNERVSYQEEVVTDGAGVLAVIRSVKKAYDLIMVGRSHGDSKIMSEVRRLSTCHEIGAIGELLAASDLNDGASVLIVQQQTRVWGLHDPEESLHLRRVSL